MTLGEWFPRAFYQQKGVCSCERFSLEKRFEIRWINADLIGHGIKMMVRQAFQVIDLLIIDVAHQ
jgi:hypothetical protein